MLFELGALEDWNVMSGSRQRMPSPHLPLMYQVGSGALHVGGEPEIGNPVLATFRHHLTCRNLGGRWTED